MSISITCASLAFSVHILLSFLNHIFLLSFNSIAHIAGNWKWLRQPFDGPYKYDSLQRITKTKWLDHGMDFHLMTAKF